MARGPYGRHRPLHCFRNPRTLSNGKYAYVYRREAGATTGFETGTGRKFPTLYMTEKIKDKAGLVFYNVPHFKHLRESDAPNGRIDKHKDAMEDLSSLGRLRLKTLNKKAEEYDKDELKLKAKRKDKKKDPSIKSIKEHLRKIIKYHEKQVHDMIPSIYPLLGPANSDEEDGGEDQNGKRDEKRERTKREMKQYPIN